MRKALTAVQLAVLTVATGCPGDQQGEAVSRRIGPDGGQISSHDGALTILLPPGALGEETEVEIEPSDIPPASAGSAYRVRPDIDLRVGAEITFRDDSASDPAVLAVGAIHREDFTSGDGKWRALQRVALEPELGLVVGVDSELALFYSLLDGGVGTGTATGDPTMGQTGPTGGSVGPTSFGPTTGFPDLSHAADIQPIWEANCVIACHQPVADGGMLSAVIRLDGDAYDDIVDVFAATATAPYISPGDPAASYLMHKLDGTHLLSAAEGGCGCNGGGVTMPLAAVMLDADTRAIIRAWIEQGAMP